jgi:hypothetical protein
VIGYAEHNMAWDDSDAEEDEWGECCVAAPACRAARVLAHRSRACLGVVRRASTYVCPSVPRVFFPGQTQEVDRPVSAGAARAAPRPLPYSKSFRPCLGFSGFSIQSSGLVFIV